MSITGYYHSPIGTLMVTADESSLRKIKLVREDAIFECRYADHPVLAQTFHWLDDYFSKKEPEVNALPLAPQGTPFQLKVWNMLLSIPYGSSATYGQIAKELARYTDNGKMSPKAVGQAVGANPIAVVIPCHRVLGLNNKLSGYAYGLDTKRWLLYHENIPYKD